MVFFLNLFEGNEIRSIWDMLKKRMTEEEKSELYTFCVQLKLKASDGKLRKIDTLDIKGILRLIESVPSPKAEPFKMWLADLGETATKILAKKHKPK